MTITIKTNENTPQYDVLYMDEYNDDWYFLGEAEWSTNYWEFYAPERELRDIMDRDGVVRNQPQRIIISVDKEKFKKNWHPLLETPKA